MLRRTAVSAGWKDLWESYLYHRHRHGAGYPKTGHRWWRKHVPVVPEAKALKPMRRSQLAFIDQLYYLDKWERRLTPMRAWIWFMTGFLGFHGTLSAYNSNPIRGDKAKFFEEMLSPTEKMALDRKNDPNRIPWPVVHKYVTEMREGKRNLDDLGKLWQQTKHYYPHDWLIPIELTQILKYSTGKLLSQYVDEPEEMRKQLMLQLINIRYDRVRMSDRVTEDAKEIIAIACDDLAALDFSDKDRIPLVPTHSSRTAGSDQLMGNVA